ncbi:hypothetical protein GCM10027176_52310 [Actinoallomurus bryophytorum]
MRARGTNPIVEPDPLPGGRDDGAGDDPGEGTAVHDRCGSGPVQRIDCSHTNRVPSAHTSPPAVEIGTPIQKPQPAQLASHHDMSNLALRNGRIAGQPSALDVRGTGSLQVPQLDTASLRDRC